MSPPATTTGRLASRLVPPLVSFATDLLSRARVHARPRSRLRALVPHGARHTTALGWGDLDDRPLSGSSIHEALESHEGHLVHKWRHYPDVYAELLTPWRAGFVEADGTTRPLRLLEIGVSEGGSLELWRRWFGADATIVGIDIDETCAGIVDPSVATVRIGSQADPAFLRQVVADMGGVDVVIDDGSHVASHQRTSLETLWPLLTDGGLYLCEDTHTAYWPAFDGGLRRRGTAIEVAKDLVDDLHRWYYRTAGSDTASAPKWPDLWSVTFHDSIISLRKRTRERPTRVARGSTVRPEGQWGGSAASERS